MATSSLRPQKVRTGFLPLSFPSLRSQFSRVHGEPHRRAREPASASLQEPVPSPRPPFHSPAAGSRSQRKGKADVCQKATRSRSTRKARERVRKFSLTRCPDAARYQVYQPLLLPGPALRSATQTNSRLPPLGSKAANHTARPEKETANDRTRPTLYRPMGAREVKSTLKYLAAPEDEHRPHPREKDRDEFRESSCSQSQ